VADDDRDAGTEDLSRSAAEGGAGGALPAVPGASGATLVQGRARRPTPSWIPRFWLYAVLAVLATLGLLGFLGKMRGLLIWLLIALFLSFALEPAVNWLHRHGWKRGLATALVLFVLLIVGVGMVASMVPLVINQIQELIGKITGSPGHPGWLHDLSKLTKKWFGVELSTSKLLHNLDTVKSNLGKYAANVAGHLLRIAASLVGFIFELLTIALFTFYMVADGPKFRRTVCSVFPPERQRRVIATWEVAIDKTGGYLYSRLLLALLSGLGTFIVLTILGVPFAVALALWMGLVSQFVPVVGTYIAMLLPVLVALGESPADAVVVLVYFAVYQQIENYLLSPKITARTMQLHPAVAFGSAIVGGGMLGPIGAFLALPAAAIIQAVLSTYMGRYEVIESTLVDDDAPPPPPKPPRRGFAVRLVERFRRRGGDRTGDGP
jgi:predicted PurR-regulated permease PerM